jgi:hypothetical protein
LSVSLPGFTPGLPDVFGVPVQPSNLSPPGVCFVCESPDGLALADVFDCAFACACADAFALGPAVEVEAEPVALVEACAAWPGGVPWGLSAQAIDPVSALISAATNTAPRARLFIAAVSFRRENP